MEHLPFVSIIIPTYNRAGMLPLTLDSFLAQSYPNERYEIIVADNNSTDRTNDIIQTYCSRFGQMKTLFEGRQGVHYARNSAAKLAKGDILYYTDDDMVADKHLLKEIVKVFDLDPDIGSATGMIIGKFDVDPPKWVKKYLINGYLSLTDAQIKDDLIVTSEDIVFSCHQAIRRDVFFSAGGFNPENVAGTWIGDGETGLNMKIKNHGYKFAYTSKSIIYHMIPKERMTFKYLIKRIGNQGFCDAYTNYRKHRDRSKIIPLMLKRNTIDLIATMGFLILKFAIGERSWHFLPAYLVHFHKSNIYDWKLYTDENFRKIVEIDDWINHDPPIKFFNR